MATTTHRTWRRTSTLALLLAGILSTFPVTNQTQEAHAAAPTDLESPDFASPSGDDVIFIDGFSPNAAVDCNGTWGTAENYLRTHGWTGQFYTVGYYNGDSNCYFNQLPYYANCANYHASNLGTTSEDLKLIACDLAWFIYNDWTYYRGLP